MEHLEMEKQAINEEKCNLASKIEDLQAELTLKSDQVQEEQTAKSNIEKELILIDTVVSDEVIKI
jgi:predicted  nucleic acid-binding Zn-ribbon protein